MNITVLTASSAEFEPLAEITEPSKRAYAENHGYEFLAAAHVEPQRVAFERVEIWIEALRGTDWLFFTGCDAAITNPQVKLESLIDDDSDFIFAVDGCGLQSDSWLMRNCEATHSILDWVLDFESLYPNEQDAMQCYLAKEPILMNFLASLPELRKSGGSPSNQRMIDFYISCFNKSPVRCKIAPQRSINAYPMQYYGGTGQEPYSWHPGDFVAHLPGKSLEERIRIFKEILKV